MSALDCDPRSIRAARDRQAQALPWLVVGEGGRRIGRARSEALGRVTLVRQGVRLGVIDPVDLGDDAAVDFACAALERQGWRVEAGRALDGQRGDGGAA